MFTAMIVDDEKWVRTALRFTIEDSNMPVTIIKECEDGQEAWAWLQANSVDLVLADIRMPGLDGLGLVRKLREAGDSQDVILITVHDDFQLVQAALRLGVVDYLLKPVSREDVIECFQKWMKRHSYPHPAAGAGKRPEVIDKVIHFMETTPLASVNLSEAAKYVHLTPSYLSYLFKQHMNKTFVEYLTGVRMREAKKLLRTTSLSVAEIAERLAYGEVAYFSNCFKKETGVSPSKYRQNDENPLANPMEAPEKEL